MLQTLSYLFFSLVTQSVETKNVFAENFSNEVTFISLDTLLLKIINNDLLVFNFDIVSYFIDQSSIFIDTMSLFTKIIELNKIHSKDKGKYYL